MLVKELTGASIGLGVGETEFGLDGVGSRLRGVGRQPRRSRVQTDQQVRAKLGTADDAQASSGSDTADRGKLETGPLSP